MKIRTFGPGLSALSIIVAGTGCHAEQTGYLSYGNVSIPLEAVRAHDDPSTPFHNLVERLKDKGRAEAQDGALVPIVSTRPWGPRHDRVLVSAITPTRGVFYVSEYGPWGIERGSTAPGRHINVCRFTVIWDKLPGGAYVPGILWASWAFPGVDCRAPTATDLSRLEEWRRNSERASYTVAAKGREFGLIGTVIREAWRQDAAAQPIDAKRALISIIGRDAPILRAIPISDDVPLYAVTATGRTFFGMTDDPPTSTRGICIVEGLRWSQVAATSEQSRMREAKNLCARLFRSSVMHPAEGDRPTMKPL
jgi:hypothetical protein